MRIFLFLPILLLQGAALYAQPAAYSAANAHSHNDYEQKEPFLQAYRAGFGSIEADIFLREGELYVAHDPEDIQPGRTLEALYLQPAAAAFRSNKGRAFPGSGRTFQLLIDLKTDAGGTLPVLTEQLGRYPGLFDAAANPDAVKVILSGNRPDPASWPAAPSFIYFDGRPGEDYAPAVLERIALVSDSFGKYSQWKGEGPIPGNERQSLLKVVKSAHEKGKPFRFWAVPDTPAAWKLMTELGVDFINTDTIEDLAAWLEKR
ncbi:MAG TPA: phosphatidylinositol-specific phospholipase C/glycerophosphodiester phosphodiesterase family protein [Anseongella sp.]|nr:phosphatidylinositol-specific phospholipase C/glycerophosphodiester phosphodiesterase family protein [Anseongella sp.]